jgi:hypothetical protein
MPYKGRSSLICGKKSGDSLIFCFLALTGVSLSTDPSLDFAVMGKVKLVPRLII